MDYAAYTPPTLNHAHTLAQTQQVGTYTYPHCNRTRGDLDVSTSELLEPSGGAGPTLRMGSGASTAAEQALWFAQVAPGRTAGTVTCHSQSSLNCNTV